MTRAKESVLFKDFIVGRDRARVSHLQFVNDTIFFSKASLEFLQNLKLVILVLGQLLGLNINLEKNTLFGINVSQELICGLVLTLECRVSE